MSEPSLEEFLSESRGLRPRRCATCALPPDVLAQVNAALRQKSNHKAIGKWLTEVKGIHTTPTNYHFNAGHHLEDA